MKKKLFILCTLIVSMQLHAQVKKIYGYKQDVVGGTMQVDDNTENKSSNEKPIQTERTRYFLFAEIDRKKSIIPQQLWINKKQYSFTIDTVKSFPAIRITSDGGDRIFRDTLIASANGYVIQLKDPVQIKQQHLSKNIQKNILDNSIVFIYRYHNKTYRIFLKNIKALRPLFIP